MSKTALITGATSGIGKATAQILAKNNYKIIPLQTLIYQSPPTQK